MSTKLSVKIAVIWLIAMWVVVGCFVGWFIYEGLPTSLYIVGAIAVICITIWASDEVKRDL